MRVMGWIWSSSIMHDVIQYCNNTSPTHLYPSYLACMLNMARIGSRLLRGLRQTIESGSRSSASISTATVMQGQKLTEPDDCVTDKKIFEFRTYAIRPDKFGECMKIIENNIHIRTAHSKLVGFWITELGGINEVYHLWEFGKFWRSGLCPSPQSHDTLTHTHTLSLSHTQIHTHTFIDNYQHRAAVRKALTLDEKWNEQCLSKIRPMFISQVVR